MGCSNTFKGNNFLYQGLGHYLYENFFFQDLPKHNFSFEKGEVIKLIKETAILLISGRKEEILELEKEISEYLDSKKNKKYKGYEKLKKSNEYFFKK